MERLEKRVTKGVAGKMNKFTKDLCTKMDAVEGLYRELVVPPVT